MEFKNGEKYKSNYARAAAYFAGTCAERPVKSSQIPAYEMIMGIYYGIMDNPEKYGLNPTADIWFESWEQQRDRKKDVKIIRDSIKKIEQIIADLFSLVTNSQINDNSFILNPDSKKLSKQLKCTLTASDCTFESEKVILPDGTAESLLELAIISQNNTIPITDGPQEDKGYLLFSRCVFEPSSNWTAKVFDRGLNAGGNLVWLCDELEKRGYERVDCKDGKRVSLDYVKLYGDKDAPLKMSWADKFHYGIELTQEDLRLEPYFIWLRMPSFKTVLERCNELSESAARFICDNTKTCDGCRYCVQTDKTGNRPLAAVSVGDKKKCPYFPSFSMNWRHFTAEMAQDFLNVLDGVYTE